MKLNAKQDIEAPVAFVHGALTDFDGWERAALRRGAEVERTDTLRATGPGMTWRLRFSYRGRERKMRLFLRTLDPAGKLVFDIDSPSVEGQTTLDLLQLSARRTRLTLTVDLQPKTLAARLFLQSLKLARTKVQRRLEMRVGQLAADIEDRFKQKRA